MSTVNKEKDRHPSFGLIGWSRQQVMGIGGGAQLFGSDLLHSNLISVKVHEASRERKLSKSWVYADKLVTEVVMSPHQFSEFLTSPNQGSGIPCTIRHTQTERNIKYEGFETEEALHNQEVREQVRVMNTKSKHVKARLKELADGGAVKKSDFNQLKGMVEVLIQEYHSNLPFIEDSFKKSMAKTVAAGKTEIESFINSRIHAAGLEKLLEDENPLVAFQPGGGKTNG